MIKSSVIVLTKQKDLNNEILPCLEIIPQSKPEASVIWLHGLGADGYDFEPVAFQLTETAPLPVRFILPHAPSLPVTVNGGMLMPAWFDIVEMANPGKTDWSGIEATREKIERLIKREIQLGIPSQKLVLAGFSQGGAIALHTGLRYDQQLAGILALSTHIGDANESTLPSLHAANMDTPLLMIHGQDDPIIPISLAKASRDTLINKHYTVEWIEYPMMHAVCEEEINAIAHWLEKVLNK